MIAMRLLSRLPRLFGVGRRKSLPAITVVESKLNHYKAFTSPNPDTYAIVTNALGQSVGRATYAVSPLVDRVYVFEITVFDQWRRQGYGTALMSYLVEHYKLPITPVKQLSSANGFWDSLRTLWGRDTPITEPLSVGDMADEALRWQHLRPVADRLDMEICKRLSDGGEHWDLAVGRGLD